MNNREYVMLDTDFLIEIFSGNKAVQPFILQPETAFYLSIIIKAELLRGVLNK